MSFVDAQLGFDYHGYFFSLSKGVFSITRGKGMTLVEIADGITVDEVRAATGAPFDVADPLPKMG